jgi:hypothetical protein
MGDLNNDGAEEIGISSYTDNVLYVIWGKPTPATFTNLALASISVGVGLRVTHVNNSIARGSLGIGDINNDTYDDFAFGVLDLFKVVIIYGSSSLTSLLNLDASTLNGVNGFYMTAAGATTWMGYRYLGGFDINNDGR